MTTWNEVLTVIRRTVLDEADVTNNEYTWPNSVVYDGWVWAQREFCAHTAQVKVLEIADGSQKDPSDPTQGTWDMSSDTEFPLPDDIYELLDTSGLVSSVSSDGSKSFYDPLFNSSALTPYASNDMAFWTSSANTLHLTTPPGAGNKLRIAYFAYWPEPADENDTTFVMAIPQWAMSAVMYLTGAHCMTGKSVRSSSIRQWNVRDDSGRPVDNTLIQEADWLVKRAWQILERKTPQDRTNFFRSK